tara:strand:- start:1782 stop:3044 length:1263 start_codon:yes stop_codon:yes gene_type:complete
MEAYVGVLNYAIPFFLILIFFEAWIGHVKGEKVVRSMDTLASLISGVTNVFKDVLGLTVIIVSYDWMVDNLSLIRIEKTWMIYLLAFIGLDFSGYWVHRISHKINYFWNHHLVHHSSEEFNLGCALRQSISKWFSISFVFLLPTALLGVPAQIVAFIAPLHLFSQYWYHTKLIGKLGFLEYVLVTPSHHRVHHAINDIYIDKNLSQIFIFWDKIFGTFQVELAHEPPVYGVKKSVKSWNPFVINFIHLWQLMQDAWRAKSWYDKLIIWFKPTGWRPKDVAEAYPIQLTEPVYDQLKYDPAYPLLFHIWCWFQWAFISIISLIFFNHTTEIGYQVLIYFGGFMYLSIASMTLLMDKHWSALYVEILKNTIAVIIVFFYGDWFMINSLFENGALLIVIYHMACMTMASYFHRLFKSELQVQV